MRWIIRAVAALLVLGLGLLAGLALVPGDPLARAAVERFESVTGRRLVIEGAARPVLWPVLGVRTGRVTLANAPWSDAGPMLEAQSLAIGLDMAGLLRGEVRITALDLTAPVIRLERSAAGVGNWVFGGANGGTASADMAGADRPFTLDRGVIRDGTLRFTDHATGRSLQLDGLSAEARLPDFAGALSLQATARLQGQPLAVTARLDDFATAYRGAVFPLTLVADLGTARVDFDGRAGISPPVAEGALVADLSDRAALAVLAGGVAPALPEGLGARQLALDGDVTLAPEGSLHLRNGHLTLDGAEIAGEADLTQGPNRPRLVARLTTPSLSLGGGAGGGDTATASADGGWSTAPLEAGGLAALDAEMAIRAGTLRLGPLALQDVTARLSLQDARAVLVLEQARAYGGALTGQIVVNGRKGLSLGTDLSARGIGTQPLLDDLMGVTRLAASGDLSLRAVASGRSVAALMADLEGEGNLALGPGRIEGLDVGAMVRALTTEAAGSGAQTAFDSLTGSFRISAGDLLTEDLRLAAPYLTATGAGRIGIGARDLDLRLRPSTLQTEDGTGGITVPLWITGPWSAPRYALDLKALAAEGLADQAAAVEDRLKEKAAAELDQQAGESLEDAARRKLDEDLGAAAGGLLQQLLGTPAPPAD